MSAGSARRPAPTSPPASRPSPGPRRAPRAGAASARLSWTAGCSHISVCMAGHTITGRPGGEDRGGEQPVGDAVGVGAEKARRGRDDQHEIGATARDGCAGWGRPRSTGDVLHRLRRQRRERHLAHEAGGVVGEHGDDVRAGVDEAATHLDRLVGGDAAGDAQDDGLRRDGRHHARAPGSVARALPPALAGLRLVHAASALATPSGASAELTDGVSSGPAASAPSAPSTPSPRPPRRGRCGGRWPCPRRPPRRRW